MEEGTSIAFPSPDITRVLVVTGPVGAGKTTLIKALVRNRQPDDRWAWLVNDFGNAEPDEEEGLSVETLAGCACCTATLVVRKKLVDILRRKRPAHLIIELSTLGSPAGLSTLLTKEFSKFAKVGCVIALVPVETHEKLLEESDTYPLQLDESSVWLLIGGQQSQVDAISNWASTKSSPKIVFALPALEPEAIQKQLSDALSEVLLISS
mmetsp:Transcript_78911/g.124586  ORF Transcript_78911/g.124586 Transcript_78911/m.124586 type:complete len:209 (+) Transcript_78911:108-734(+)